MARRNLEKAIIAGKLIESGLKPLFRFSKVESHRCLKPVEDPALEDVGIHSVQFTTDGKFVAYGTAASSVNVVNCSKIKDIVVVKPPRHKHGFPVSCLRFLPKEYDKLLGCTALGEVFVMQIDRSGWEVIMNEKNETFCFDVNGDGSQLATAGHDGLIRVYDIRYPAPVPSVNLFDQCNLLTFLPSAVDEDITGGHTTRVFSVRFHPTFLYQIVSAGWDNVIRIWDTRYKKSPSITIGGPHVCSSDALDVNEYEILTGSWAMENALQIWDIRKVSNGSRIFEPVEVLPMIGSKWTDFSGDGQNDCEYIYSAAFGEMGVVIAGGSGFHGVRVVRRVTHEPVGQICSRGKATAQSMDCVFGGRTIAVGYSDGTLELAHMS